MNSIDCLKEYLGRIGFPESVLAELTPAIDGLSERSQKVLGSYMYKRARMNLLNYGVTESALKVFKADRDPCDDGSWGPVNAGPGAKPDKEAGPKPDDQGRYEVRVSGAIVSDTEYENQSKGADLVAPVVVREKLDTLPQGSPILLLVNSPGGDVHAASEIGDMLDRWEGKVTGRITGIAASAGALLMLLAADEIECTTLGKWMFHQSHVAGLTSEGLLSLAGVLEKTDRKQAELLSAGSSLSPEAAWDVVASGDDSWYDASQAADIGLSSAIEPKPERRQEARLSDWGKKQAQLSRELMLMA